MTRPAAGLLRRCARRAFTLVEVLIVVLILGIMATLALPNLANATAPLTAPIGELLAEDLRRARLESMSLLKETVVVVGADRDRWWIQAAGELDEARALPSSLRILGTGNLRPYAAQRLEVALDGAPPPKGDAVLARFDIEGTRDDAALSIALVGASDDLELARWHVAPQRTRLK